MSSEKVARELGLNLHRYVRRFDELQEELCERLNDQRGFIEEQVVSQAQNDGYQVIIPLNGTPAGALLLKTVQQGQFTTVDLNQIAQHWVRQQAWGEHVNKVAFYAHTLDLVIRWR